MSANYVYAACLCATICALFIRTDYLKDIVNKYSAVQFFNSYYSTFNHVHQDDSLQFDNIEGSKDQKIKIYTPDSLEKHTNIENGIYLAILGEVFDVSTGSKHYGPGAPYHIFTGKDASAAFITGDFSPEGLTDDVSQLTRTQIVSLHNWVEFYRNRYLFLGVLQGRYYSKNGSPTSKKYLLEQIVEDEKNKKLSDEEIKKMFPPCNIEWDESSGSRVWCTQKSGGISRDWIGVPRLLFESPYSKQSRCACVNLKSKEYKEYEGLLRKYHDNCDTQYSCSIENQ